MIAFTAAAVFYAASRKLQMLVRHAVVAGMLYGVAVYFFMNLVVLPFSLARRHGFVFSTRVLIDIGGHMLLVGLPIALAARKFGGNSTSARAIAGGA